MSVGIIWGGLTPKTAPTWSKISFEALKYFGIMGTRLWTAILAMVLVFLQVCFIEYNFMASKPAWLVRIQFHWVVSDCSLHSKDYSDRVLPEVEDKIREYPELLLSDQSFKT